MSSHFVGKPSPAASPCPQASMLVSATRQLWHWEIPGGQTQGQLGCNTLMH